MGACISFIVRVFLRLAKYGMVLTLALNLISTPIVYGLTASDINSALSNTVWFNAEDECGVTGPGIQELEGHKLPAYKGGAGNEEPINSAGGIPSGGTVTFSGFAGLGKEYQDYYITMRWRYASWIYIPTPGNVARAGSEDISWYGEKPRLVLVTNPDTGKSIIAPILEAGPAPYAGTPGGKNDAQQKALWEAASEGDGYTEGTPEGYLGRVAGFPPVAREALGMEQWEYGGPNSGNPRGKGSELVYSWAPDQNAKPGPTAVSAGTESGDAACVGSANGFVFPLQTTQTAIKEGVDGDVWCYKRQENCHHDYNAADIFSETGTPVLAAKSGTVVSTTVASSGVGTRAQIKGDDGILYYYTHMGPDFLKVNKGDHVNAGQQIGGVGQNEQAVGTTRHLHFDMLPSEFNNRPSCSGKACKSYPFINVQPMLIESFNALPQ